MNRSLVLATILAVSSTGGAGMPPTVRSLVDAERAFAKMARDVSMRDAFLMYLAETGLVFNPGPIDGRALWEKRPQSDALLAWEPVYAEVSASGDFGFTTGPWSFSRDHNSDPVAFGHFVSIWKRGADGVWRVALDIGSDHERNDAKASLSYRAGENPVGLLQDARTREQSRDALLGTDAAFAAAFARSAAGAFRDFGAEDVRRYRSGSSPVVGIDAVRVAAGEMAGGPMSGTSADIAASGDLGYTMGTRGTPVAAYYVRIWRLDENAKWRVVLDIESAVPAGD